METQSDGFDFEDIRRAEPSASRVEAIQDQIAASLHPVKPLPSDRVLVSGLLAGFVCLGVLCAIPIGLKGFHAMTTAQRLVDYCAILLGAWALARIITAEMIPGARRSVPPAVSITAAFAMTIGVTVLLFPDYSMIRFVRSGIPCLVIGTVCAIPAGFLVWRVIRLGMMTETMPLALASAVLSGLTGVFVLALHCPILNAAHILTWHVGVPALALGIGAGLARRIDSRITESH
jgi:hypothetical protein